MKKALTGRTNATTATLSTTGPLRLLLRRWLLLLLLMKQKLWLNLKLELMVMRMVILWLLLLLLLLLMDLIRPVKTTTQT